MRKNEKNDSEHKRYLKVYEEYWNHARHQELYILYFTNIYAIIVAGLLIAIQNSWEDDYCTYLITFLLVLSIIGYFIVFTKIIPFYKFSRLAERIAENVFCISNEYLRFKTYKKTFEN